MREMNSGVAEDIVNGETAMVGTRQEMGIIGFRGDATTAQPRDVLAADTPAWPPPCRRHAHWPGPSGAALLWVNPAQCGRRGAGGAAAVPRSPGSCSSSAG